MFLWEPHMTNKVSIDKTESWMKSLMVYQNSCYEIRQKCHSFEPKQYCWPHSKGWIWEVSKPKWVGEYDSFKPMTKHRKFTWTERGKMPPLWGIGPHDHCMSDTEQRTQMCQEWGRIPSSCATKKKTESRYSTFGNQWMHRERISECNGDICAPWHEKWPVFEYVYVGAPQLHKNDADVDVSFGPSCSPTCITMYLSLHINLGTAWGLTSWFANFCTIWHVLTDRQGNRHWGLWECSQISRIRNCSSFSRLQVFGFISWYNSFLYMHVIQNDWLIYILINIQILQERILKVLKVDWFHAFFPWTPFLKCEFLKTLNVIHCRCQHLLQISKQLMVNILSSRFWHFLPLIVFPWALHIFHWIQNTFAL